MSCEVDFVVTKLKRDKAAKDKAQEEARAAALLTHQNAHTGSKRQSGRPLSACKKQKTGEENA